MKSAVAILFLALPAAAGDFEMLFSPNGHVRSFAYFSQGSDNFIAGRKQHPAVQIEMPAKIHKSLYGALIVA